MHKNPARKLKASAVKNICKFPSTKSFGGPSHLSFNMILVESLLEKDYCFHLEFDSNVLQYFPQPRKFFLSSQTLCNRAYTPDFVVHYRDGRKAYIEVKKDSSALDKPYLLKLELAAIEMERDGYEFRLVEESQIRIEPLLSNLKRLQRYRKEQDRNAESFVRLRESVPHPETLSDLLGNPLGIKAETIYGLVATGRVKTNLSVARLSVNSEVAYE